MRTFAEWVLPGHPDKISDRIADSIVDVALALDPKALVGVEVAIHRDHVFLDGRVACPGAESINFEKIVKDVFVESGYGKVFPPDPKKLAILKDLCLGDFRPEEKFIRTISDDQNIITGFAEFNPSTNHLPLAHFVAWTIARCFDEKRKDLSEQLGSDGKVLVVINSEIENSEERHYLESVSFSVHHASDLGTIEIVTFAKKVIDQARKQLDFVVFEWPGGKTEVIVNGAGDFAVGGPEGDNGLSGKKLVIDAYGPHLPIGGGALSGKDPHKIDRVVALRARQIAKHIVISGIAERALVYLAFAPGDHEPRWKEIQFGTVNYADNSTTWEIVDRPLVQRWLSGYDLTIEGTFNDLDLSKVLWKELAAWGHFTNPNLPWERWNPGRG